MASTEKASLEVQTLRWILAIMIAGFGAGVTGAFYWGSRIENLSSRVVSVESTVSRIEDSLVDDIQGRLRLVEGWVSKGVLSESDKRLSVLEHEREAASLKLADLSSRLGFLERYIQKVEGEDWRRNGNEK